MALIKARVVAGNLDLGRRFLEAVQPVVYRRFMDYSVLEDIRGLKDRIIQEARTHLLAEDNIKLGPGGIREIEFIVQALQLVFGGRLPAIRERIGCGPSAICNRPAFSLRRNIASWFGRTPICEHWNIVSKCATNDKPIVCPRNPSL